MKKIIVLIIAAVIVAASLASCGGEGEKADSEKGNTDTAVTVPESESESGRDGLTVEEIKDDAGKTVGAKAYDANGILRYEESYDFAGRTVDRTDYNEDGKPTTVSSYTFLSGEEPDHYVVEKYDYNDGGVEQRTVTRYNRMSAAESIYVYGPDGELIEGYLYEYGDTGLLVKESSIDSQNVLKLITEYEYNEDGKPSKETYRKGSGVMSSYVLFDYNENGTISRESSYSPEGEMYGYLEYVYDADGNFVEQVEYVQDEDGNYVRF